VSGAAGHAGYAAAVFDCDGVILDSNPIKITAFREVLADHPRDVVERFVRYHRENGGISRYEKMRLFYSDFLRREVDEDAVETLLEAFGAACRRLYPTCPVTEGCVEALDALGREMPLYVASGSDEAELRDVLRDKALAPFFAGIYGSPKPKPACVREIVERAGSRRLLFVGDAAADHEAAVANGIDFVFMSAYSDAREEMLERARRDGFPVIHTLKDLRALVPRLP
jgi:phosphoglycolate phosphatase-like HAD superfamily hydrolase